MTIRTAKHKFMLVKLGKKMHVASPLAKFGKVFVTKEKPNYFEKMAENAQKSVYPVTVPHWMVYDS